MPFYNFSEQSKKANLRLQFFDKSLKKDKLLRGEYEKVKLSYLQGTIKNDLIATGFSSVFLVSDRVVNIFESNQISGWKLFDVFSDDLDLSNYYGFGVVGNSGPIINELSIQTVLNNNNAIKKPFLAYQGLFIDTNTWDGSNIFCPRGTSYIFITSTVKNLLEKHRITNVDFLDTSKVINYNLPITL